ncbi:MAG TPA: hypothetical protein VF867_18815 [Arthrobacter sp.]
MTSTEKPEPVTSIVTGHMNIFPKDTARQPDGTDAFSPHPKSVVYPTAPIGRKDGDRRAPLRAVEFNVAEDEFFTVLRELERGAGLAAKISAGSFMNYSDAYLAMTENVPRGYRAEIKIMAPTTSDVLATGPDGEEVVVGESLTWQPQAIADRLRLSESER